jgi:membrane protein implicated in regulation of membrane protease activity
VVLISCLAWIGIITMVLAYFLDLAPETAWWIAGILSLVASIGISLILREMNKSDGLPAVQNIQEFEGLPPPPPARGSHRKQRQVQA